MIIFNHEKQKLILLSLPPFLTNSVFVDNSIQPGKDWGQATKVVKAQWVDLDCDNELALAAASSIPTVVKKSTTEMKEIETKILDKDMLKKIEEDGKTPDDREPVASVKEEALMTQEDEKDSFICSIDSPADLNEISTCPTMVQNILIKIGGIIFSSIRPDTT